MSVRRKGFGKKSFGKKAFGELSGHLFFITFDFEFDFLIRSFDTPSSKYQVLRRENHLAVIRFEQYFEVFHFYANGTV